MGARRRVARAADREAATRSGWSVVGPRDVLPLTWTRAWAATPHRGPAAAHAVLAAFCAPGLLLDLAVTGAVGWFHRADRTVAVRLQPQRRQRAAVVVAVNVAVVLVYRLLSDLVGRERILSVVGVAAVYGVLVGILTHLRTRELTTRQDRQGYLRLPGLLEADWVLTWATVAGDLRPAAADVRTLVDARVPAGARVGAGSRSAAVDRQLEAAGFTAAGAPGHLVRVAPGPDGRPARGAGARAHPAG